MRRILIMITWLFITCFSMIILLLLNSCNVTIYKSGKATTTLTDEFQKCQDQLKNCLEQIYPQFEAVDNDPDATWDDFYAILNDPNTITMGSCQTEFNQCFGDAIEALEGQ